MILPDRELNDLADRFVISNTIFNFYSWAKGSPLVKAFNDFSIPTLIDTANKLGTSKEFIDRVELAALLSSLSRREIGDIEIFINATKEKLPEDFLVIADYLTRKASNIGNIKITHILDPVTLSFITRPSLDFSNSISIEQKIEPSLDFSHIPNALNQANNIILEA